MPMMQKLAQRLMPVSPDSGYADEKWYVWGGSIMPADGCYHLFVSRWPKSTGFPNGYRGYSEIIRAVADSPFGPYRYAETVLAGRGGNYWDGKMCHNPKILKTADRYVLFYIASAIGEKRRQVGCASAPSLEGPWRRLDSPFSLGEDANNPTPYIHADGSVVMAYRDEGLRMHIARADAPEGPYNDIARDIFPAGKLEDPDLFRADGLYHMIMEDNQGLLTGNVRFGGHLVSEDAVSWRPAEEVTAYTHDITYSDGTKLTAERRERPELLNCDGPSKKDGAPTHLVTGVWDGSDARCLVQEIQAG